MLQKIKEWSTQAPGGNIARANNFNVVRFVAAIMVIYGHMSAIMGVPAFCVYNQAVSTIAVKIFFIISGYLITKSYEKDSNFVRYMIRRVFRIFPGLIAVVLFAVLIVGPLTTVLPLKEYFSNAATWLYLKNILMFPMYALPGVFGDYTYPNAVNGSLWSLPVELAMYIILPLIVAVFKKLKILKPGLFITSVLFLALDVIRMSLFPQFRLVIWGNNLADWLALIPFFFIGSFLSFDNFKKYFNLQLATALLVAGSLISLNYSKSQILLFITLPYFILSFSLCEKPLFCGWFKNCDFSYGLYLYGFIIQQVLYNLLKRFGLSLNVMTLVCFVGTFICAIVSWYLIEKPMQTVAKRLLKRLTPALKQ